MKKTNKSGSASGMVISGLLSLFLIGILVFVMIGYVEILDYDAGAAALVFGIINMLAIGIVYGLGKVISAVTGTASYAAIAGVTGLYTIVQFAFMFINYDTNGIKGYVLFNLIALFVYLLIILPIGLNGAKNKND